MPDELKIKTTLVFLEAQSEGWGFLNEGRKIADDTNTQLYIINVQENCKWGRKLSRELEDMFTLSEKLNAQMLIFFSDNPIDILKDCIERFNVINIILPNDNTVLSTLEKKSKVNTDSVKVYVF
ncbi:MULTISPECIES: hypothetical protein [unclassified Sedimentibacter]|uniref:hypothetical protein n=1 Tax=unclassified Sedimentibacter TaxID=2649220 RepID=UPI0027E0FB2D|nr:hypothetical protein [Sedimentibacter sp. MB35-C1]WMJ75745.1 hypothetical protein RBQ61_08875 [Sedimentibacter sp. MB35-C1]